MARVQVATTGLNNTSSNICVASDGTVAIVPTSGSSYSFYLVSGGSASLEWTDTYETLFGYADTFGSMKMNFAIDSNDDLHFIFNRYVTAGAGGLATRDVVYMKATFNSGTSDWTKGSYTEIFGYSDGEPWQTTGTVGYRPAIEIDANDYVHIVFSDWVVSKGSGGTELHYTNNTSGSWSTPISLGNRANKTDEFDYPEMLVIDANNIEVIYRYMTNQNGYDICYIRKVSGSWGTETRNTTTNITSVAFRGICIYGSSSVQRLYRQTNLQLIDENNTVIIPNSGGNVYMCSVYYYNGTRYVLNTIYNTGQANYELHLIQNSGSGWSSNALIDDTSGYYNTDIVAYFQYHVLNDAGVIHFIYEDTTNSYTYYDTYSLVSGTDTSDNQIAFAHGSVADNDNQYAWLAGGVENSDNQIAWLNGSVNDFDNQSAYLAGLDTDADNQIAFLIGSSDDFDNQLAFTVGGIEVNDNQAAFMESYAPEASDSVSAFLSGITTMAYLNDDPDDTIVHATNITVSYGQAYELFTTSNEKILMRFDLSSIPKGSRLHSAKLILFKEDSGGSLSAEYSIYSISQQNGDWPEGSGTPSVGGAGDCCWSYKDQDPGNETAWNGSAGLSTAGDDYETTVLGTWPYNSYDPTTTKYEISLDTDRLKGWFGASNTNYGLLFIMTTGGGAAGSIRSGQYSDPAYWPKLLIEYEPGSQQSAYLAGGGSDTDNQLAYTHGQEETSGQQSGYTRGSQSDSSGLQAFTAGSISTQASTLGYLAGQDTASETQTAYLRGWADAWSSLYSYTAGQEQLTDQQPGYLIGSIDTFDNQVAWLTGGIETNDNQPAWLEGSAIAALDNQAAYLSGLDYGFDNIESYLSGRDNAFDNFVAYLSGSQDTLDNTPAYTLGSTLASDTLEGYLAGSQDVNDNQIAYLEGQAGQAQDNLTAYLKGQDDATNNQEAYSRGQSEANAQLTGYTSGEQHTSDNVSGYVRASDQVATSVPGYLSGQADQTDSLTAYSVGQDHETSNTYAYSIGWDHDLSNQPGFIHGSNSLAGSQLSYLSGQDLSSSAVSAFVAGSFPSAGETSAYLVGSQDTTNSISAYSEADTYEWLLPDNDIVVGGWENELGGTPLWSSIDDYPNTDDDDYVLYDGVTGNENFSISLSNPFGDPLTDPDGLFIIEWRPKQTQGTSTITVKVELWEAAVLIASDEQTISDTWQTFEYQLTPAEKASITAPQNLRLRVIITGVV